MRVLRFFYTKTFLKTQSTWQCQKAVSVTRNDADFGLGLNMQWPQDMSDVCETCSGLTPCATELCDVIHGQHKSMTLSGRWHSQGDFPMPDKNFHQQFFFANSCRQINIFAPNLLFLCILRQWQLLARTLADWWQVWINQSGESHNLVTHLVNQYVTCTHNAQIK